MAEAPTPHAVECICLALLLLLFRPMNLLDAVRISWSWLHLLQIANEFSRQLCTEFPANRVASVAAQKKNRKKKQQNKKRKKAKQIEHTRKPICPLGNTLRCLAG